MEVDFDTLVLEVVVSDFGENFGEFEQRLPFL